MGNDEGLVAKLEQWFADTLAALTYEDKLVFKPEGPNSPKGADVWKHQIAATGGGGEAFSRYEPFAFVSYSGADGAREGDYDLRQVLEFAILIGVESKVAGVARFGDDNNLGTSKIRDLVIAAFDRQHPGGELKCDEIYYTGEFELIDSSKRHAIRMNFETSYLTV